MNSRFVELPLRQKQLWIEVFVNLLLLVVFLADRLLRPTSNNPAIGIACLSMILPGLYVIFRKPIGNEARTDERDRAIESRGRDWGYRIMTAGVLGMIWVSSISGVPYVSGLLVVWLCSQILESSTQLRIYAGHEAWWPDPVMSYLMRRRDEHLKMMKVRPRG